jgi:HSP20 family protein
MDYLDLTPDVIKPVIYVLAESRSMADPQQQRPGMRQHAWRPPTDVFETEDVIVVRVEAAGMLEADFSVVLDGRFLSIRGVRSDTSERRAYYQMEIPFGEFASEVELPFPVDAQGIEAVYKNGFLRVTLPKVRPQKVDIEV